MTPVQQQGYKVGDKFTFTDSAKTMPPSFIMECVGFNPDDVLTLAIDDGTEFPVFTSPSGCTYNHGPDGTPGSHIKLALVTPYLED